MANRQPLILNAGNMQQLAVADTLVLGPINQQFSGLLRTTTPVGALVREWGDSIAATTGNIELGISYNVSVDPVTGIWAGRDVLDICWLERWSDVGGVKEFWSAPSAAAGVAPTWSVVYSLDTINALLTTNSLNLNGSTSLRNYQLQLTGTNTNNSASITGVLNTVTLTGGAATTQLIGNYTSPSFTPVVAGTTEYGNVTYTTHNNANAPTAMYGEYAGLNLGAAAIGGTIPSAVAFQAASMTINAATTTNITTYAAFDAGNVVQGAGQTITNVMAFRGQQNAGTNRWNLYLDGTAINYAAGQTLIGTNVPPTLTTTGTTTFPTTTTGDMLVVNGGVLSLTPESAGNYNFTGLGYSTNNSSAASIGLKAQTRGAAPTAANDVFGFIDGWGWSGTAYAYCASIDFVATSTFSGTNFQSAISFNTTPLNSTTPVSAGFLASTGLTLVGGTCSQGAYTSTYTDGAVLDYATGNGRLSVGSADTITLYTGGIATTQLAQFSTTGVAVPAVRMATGAGAGTLLASATAPTISTGFGTAPSIVSNNGSLTFRVNIGSGGAASSGIIGMPAAANGWNAIIQVFNPTNVNLLQQTVVTSSTTSTITIANYTTSTGVITAWPSGTILIIMAAAY